MRTFTAILLFTALTINSNFTAAVPVGSPDADFLKIDESGGYHFGYNDGRVARQEERSPEGVVRGAYTYVDADGQVQVITYTADKHNGFLVSGTNIQKIGRIPEIGEVGEVIEETPAALVKDAPEADTSRADHSDDFRRALLEDVPMMTEELPVPVEYTPEVVAARAAHLRAYDQALLRISASTQIHPDYLPYAGL